MTLEEQKAHFKAITAKMKEILFKKGNDYANEDRLSNFKLAGTIAGGSAEINCLNLIATKVARLGVLLNSGKSPNNESIQDSIIDLINYGVLLDMIVTEGTVNELPNWDADGSTHIPDENTITYNTVFEYDDAILTLRRQLRNGGITPKA
jgi:hypothetical protein